MAEQPGVETPIPLIKTPTAKTGPGRGRWVTIWLQPDGSMTWEPSEPPKRPKRKPSWWKRVAGNG